MQSVSITTNVVSSNPAHRELYSIQRYVMKFISGIATDRWYSLGIPVSSTNKTDRHDMTEILKVALNTITITLTTVCFCCYASGDALLYIFYTYRE